MRSRLQQILAISFFISLILISIDKKGILNLYTEHYKSDRINLEQLAIKYLKELINGVQSENFGY